MPMAVFALISWLKNPYNGRRSEVKVRYHRQKRGRAHVALRRWWPRGVFYWILKMFHTTNLLPSTLSVTTSFLAVYLTFRRSAYFALAYASNDIVLIALWVLASLADTRISRWSFASWLLVNDLYGFINWRRMKERQRA